jgi:DNA polymerase II large subunit
MGEKLTNQLALAEKLEAVDVKKVALKVLTKHFIPDIIGNLRAFSTQSFRCKTCNKRFRRLPLSGRCSSCDGKFAVTVYRGGIEKYLQAAQNLVEKFELPEYYSQRILIVHEELSTLFENQKHQQRSISHFV